MSLDDYYGSGYGPEPVSDDDRYIVSDHEYYCDECDRFSNRKYCPSCDGPCGRLVRRTPSDEERLEQQRRDLQSRPPTVEGMRDERRLSMLQLLMVESRPSMQQGRVSPTELTRIKRESAARARAIREAWSRRRLALHRARRVDQPRRLRSATVQPRRVRLRTSARRRRAVGGARRTRAPSSSDGSAPAPSLTAGGRP